MRRPYATTGGIRDTRAEGVSIGMHLLRLARYIRGLPMLAVCHFLFACANLF